MFSSHPWFATLAIVTKYAFKAFHQKLGRNVLIYLPLFLHGAEVVSASVIVSAMLHPGQILHEALVVIQSNKILGVLSTCQYNHILLHELPWNAACHPDTIEK